MKVLFLDIDGVLNSEQFYRALYRQVNVALALTDFCPIACSNLMEILVEAPEVKIVVSSSWRIGTELSELRQILWANAKVPENRVIDKTPLLSDWGGPRGFEIQAWLDKHPEVTKFVILDDTDDMEHLKPFLVLTDLKHGLQLRDSEKVLSLLDLRTTCTVCAKELPGGYPWKCNDCLHAELKAEKDASAPNLT
jgi:hypothetical protein